MGLWSLRPECPRTEMRLRIRVKTMLAAVALTAFGLWLAIPAVEFHRDFKHFSHIHSGDTMIADRLHATPFWSWYWRRILGRPWPGSYHCPDLSMGVEVDFMDERR